MICFYKRFFMVSFCPVLKYRYKKEIVIMEERSNYVKRTQRDYSMSFKLSVVKEIELGELSTTGACRKYGIQSRSTVVSWLRKFGTFDWEIGRASCRERV